MNKNLNNLETSKKSRSPLWVVLVILFLALLMAAGISFKKMSSPSNETTHNLTAVNQQKKELYQCPMHPHITSDHPGTCPICHMDLQKVDQEEDNSAASHQEPAT